MNGIEWLDSFKKHYDCKIVEFEKRGHKKYGREWTDFIIGEVVEAVGEDFNCCVVSLGKKKELWVRGEYLGIDALFVDKKACTYDNDVYTPRFQPLSLPLVAVEHENRELDRSIPYSLWKILSVRASVRVLICYKASEDKVEELKQRLEKKIKEGKELVEGKDGENLLVIIGNKKNHAEPFEKYFSIFEWRDDRLEEIVLKELYETQR